jgi:hypothetical protein
VQSHQVVYKDEFAVFEVLPAKLLRIWRCVTGCVVHDVLKEHSALILKGHEVQNVHFSFRTWGIAYPLTQDLTQKNIML